jgi:hypothetical protein
MPEYAVIRVDPEMHRQAAIAAAQRGTTIKDITEEALRRFLSPNPVVLIDSREEYITKGEDNA